MCFNWVATAKCWRDPCPFAHGQEELTGYGVAFYGDKYKKQNCRNFFNFSGAGMQYCRFGTECLFRHEHRPFSKLHRRYYGLHLSKLESLYENTKSDKAKTSFLQGYAPDTNRLASFKQIEEAEVSDEGEDDWQLTAEQEQELYCSYHPEDIYAEKQASECGSVGHSSLLNTSEDTTNSGNSGTDNESNSCSNVNKQSFTSIFSQLMLEMLDEEAASNKSQQGELHDKEATTENLDVSLSSIGLDFVSIDD